MAALTATVNEVWEREGRRAPAARWGFLSAAAAFLATKRWQRERCKQLAPWNSTGKGGWSRFEPQPGDNRGHKSSSKRREEVTPPLMSAGLQQLMCLSEAVNLETKLNSLSSPLAGLESILVTHHTWRSAALATGQQFSQQT